MASINSISSFYSYSQYCLTLLYPSFSVLLSPLIFLDQLLLSSLLTQVRSNSKVTLERVPPVLPHNQGPFYAQRVLCFFWSYFYFITTADSLNVSHITPHFRKLKLFHLLLTS